MSNHVVPFAVGDKVEHVHFGKGKVIFANAITIRVQFKPNETQDFQTTFAKNVLKKI